MTLAARDPAQDNMFARQVILGQSINRWNSIASGTIATPLTNNVVNIPVRNVGLIKRFIIELSCTIVQSGVEVLTLTPWGPANFLSQVIFTDLANNTRVNTTGRHLHALATVRRQNNHGAAFLNDSPIAFGSNFPVIQAYQSVGATSRTVRMFFEVPITYGDFDLRGCILASVVNATMNLQFTINPNFVVSSTADKTPGVYQSSTAALGTVGSVSYNVYQNYLDQLPQGSRGPIIPVQDMSVSYDIKNTSVVGLTTNNDTPIPFANFRNFMSIMIGYDNGGTLNVGTDVNYIALESANYTNLFKLDPLIASLFTRQLIGDDFPPGYYYFDFRSKPISTIQYGNMQMLFNPAGTVNANAQLDVGFEALAYINQITQAGSLFGS